MFGTNFYDYIMNTFKAFTTGDVAGHDEFRVQYLRAGFEMIAKRPVFGWGSFGTDISQVEWIAVEFNIPQIKGNILGWTHSAYLGLLVEFGISGCLLFILYSVGLLRRSYREGLKGIMGSSLRLAFILILINALFKVILIKSLHIFGGLLLALSFCECGIEKDTESPLSDD